MLDPTKNGSIARVSAARIAAILAGRPEHDSLNADNAVTAISGITTAVIGADINGGRRFSFTDIEGGVGFDFGSADEVINGLVIVKAGGFTGAHPAPLAQFQVQSGETTRSVCGSV